MCSIPMALMAVGTLVQAGGQIAQGQAAADAGRQQQAFYNEQADAQRKASSFEQMQELRKQELQAANARAQVGASGVALAGSASEALVANAGQGQLDIEAIQFGSTMKQNQLRTQGSIAAASGRRAQSGSYIAGASTLLSGVGSIFSPSRGIRMGGSEFAA